MFSDKEFITDDSRNAEHNTPVHCA